MVWVWFLHWQAFSSCPWNSGGGRRGRGLLESAESWVGFGLVESGSSLLDLTLLNRSIKSMSETVSLVKQSTLLFSLLQKLCPFYTATTSTISVWGPVISFLYCPLLLDLVSYFLCFFLVFFRSWDGELVWYCKCGANLFFRGMFIIWIGLLLLSVFAAIHGYPAWYVGLRRHS